MIKFNLQYFFFFNDTATTEIYTLSLHDALPICAEHPEEEHPVLVLPRDGEEREHDGPDEDVVDRKSTRLNSSHANISYAVFCLKKKKYVATLHANVAPVLNSISYTPTDSLLCWH